MIVLDTNVVSEMMRAEAADAVIRWYKTVPRRALFTTAITQAEVLAGIAMMPKGRNREKLADEARGMFEKDFDGRVLAFDSAAAEHYAGIVAGRRQRGREAKPLDAQIAAIARAQSMAVATRNVKDFEDCGIDLINPWSP
jgi:toxin FitB